MNGDKDIAFLNLTFVTLGLNFRNAQADQPAGNAANGSTNGHTA